MAKKKGTTVRGKSKKPSKAPSAKEAVERILEKRKSYKKKRSK